MGTRLLYLVRHGQHDDPGTPIDDGPLTPLGERQSRLLGERLRGVPFDAIHHSPLRRATRTAELLAEALPGVPRHPADLLADCIPSNPDRAGLPPAYAAFLDRFSPAELDAGAAQAAAALARYAVATDEDRCDLIVTHNFVIGWFVARALDAPPWRWLGLNQFNCGLTIIRYRTGSPPALVSYNDIGHLPLDQRGTTPLDLRS